VTFLGFFEFDQSVEIDWVSVGSEILPYADGMREDLGGPQIVQMPGSAQPVALKNVMIPYP
jgi:hypothetical protein